MSDASEVRYSLHERLFPEVGKTDHGKFSISDLLVLLLDGCLILFTGYFSWEFLQSSMPGEYKILSVAGLWGLDFGMVFWSLVWIYGSTTEKQDWASIGMWTIDFLGVGVTTFVGFFAGRSAAIPSFVQYVSLVGVVIIILLNVFAGYFYHFNSPRTRRARKVRKMREELDVAGELAELKLEREKLQLQQDARYLEQRRDVVNKEKELAELAVELETIDSHTRGVLAKMRSDGKVPVTSNGNGNGNGNDKVGSRPL